MKKIFYVLLLSALALISKNLLAQPLGNWSNNTASFPGLGTSSSNPYMITTPQQLAYLAVQVNRGFTTYTGSYFRLDADLDLGAHYWMSIGTIDSRFKGQFDGNGKTIKNMIVRSWSADYDSHGLFGVIESATIRNLHIVDCDVEGDYHVGGLVGIAFSGGSIVNCSVTGTVSGYKNHTGGLIGFSYCSLTNCHSEANVMGSSYVGGLAGSSDSYISGCSATGNVRGLFEYAGGLVGFMECSTMTDCYAAGSVTGMSYVGGLIGATNEGCTITGCFAVGAVTGVVPLFGSSLDIGGLIGILGLNCRVEECFASGAVTGDVNVGGLAGRTASSESVVDCYAVGTVTGFSAVGGLIGEDDTKGEIRNCYTAGAIVGTSDYGGFSGTMYGKTASFYATCCFDQQATGMTKGIGNHDIAYIKPFTTPSLTDGGWPLGLDRRWLATEGYYPQLERFATHSNARIREWSGLSVTPLFLANTEELCNDVKTSFSLVEKTALGASITWSVSPVHTNSIDNYRIYCGNKGEWNRLTLTSGACSRMIAFRSEKGFSEADLLAFVVEGKRYDPKNPTRIVIDCTSTAYETRVQLEISRFATASTDNIITVKTDKPALFTYDITITSVDGSKSKKYTLEVEKPFSPDIFVQRWYDVLAVNNNFATNGGYHFVAYEWYKGTAKQQDTKGYIQEPGGLNKSVSYWAILTTQQGARISACPAVLTSMTTRMAVYPNPVLRGQTVRVEGRDAACHVSTMQLFDTAGNIIAKQTIHNPVEEIAMPDTPGQYILQITVNGVSETFKIIVE